MILYNLGMSVTAKDIAKELNISAAAVSMALNNKPGVSDETRALVFETANRMGFKFSKKMLKRNNKMVAFVFFHKNFIFETPFFTQLGRAVEDTLKEEGYHINAYHIHEHEDIQNQIGLILKEDPIGLILLGTLVSDSEIEYFNDIGIPTVVLDGYFENYSGDTVVINNVEGAKRITNYLINRCHSCPGYISSRIPFKNLEERADGFFDALRTNGYHASKAIVHKVIPSTEGAYGEMLEIISSNTPLADCYFCDNDEIALGAMRAFLEKGYRIPEDISIVGFDNMYYSQYVDPPLTSLDVPKMYMGHTAAKMLLYKIANPDERNTIKIEINTTLIVRKSVK